MSYLNALRLHFAGRFQANVSTVNNDPGHYDNTIFQQSYQQMEGVNMNPPNGWFNPQGDADWRFLGCKITSAWMPGPQNPPTVPSVAVPTSDPVLACIIADSDQRAPAKLADLDPEQQLVSEIWGLQVRIADATGNTLMRGDFEHVAFIDIWDRATVSSGGDADAGAVYQSVLKNLQWGDVSKSPFLLALQKAASDGLLSIKFNVDAFNLDYTRPGFMTGRIAGTIGPASKDEPMHLVIGRQFMAGPNAGGNFYKPPGGINYCAARVDANANCIYLDLGNALPTAAGGAMEDLGDLTLSVSSPASGSTTALGTIPAKGTNGYAIPDGSWYSKTAGVVVLPINPQLMSQVQTQPLTLSGNPKVTISEWPSGAFVRADTFVYRLSPGDTASIPVYAMQFGQPLPKVQISFVADSSQLQAQEGSGFPFVITSPNVATPANAIQFAASATTNEQGCATLALTAKDPGTPRNFNITPANPTGDYGIDGQVYGVRAGFVDTQTYGSQPENQWNFISFLVWSGFTPKSPGNPTWNDDLQPIFTQYANLYPVMSRFLNLSDYASVKANSGLLSLAFGLNVANPNSMPVTRDLSPAKRQAILQWLQNGLPLGEAPPPKASARVALPQPTPPATATPTPPKKGGKAMAAARRLVVQKTRKGERS
ncbi:hypothetical protein [Hyalangium minutum]|uniref:Uncharacterized protein n=1 Tax=Hyalangium minutum TaxID=394096 RepID=A0A085WT23_9BACT|nr:hypothetical protein [Hyalangium minutum]KFE70836.1 hypothetical protein DB31_5878 [Hyalangium minutum]